MHDRFLCVFVVKIFIREQGRVSRSDVAHPGREIWARLSARKTKKFFLSSREKTANCSRELRTACKVSPITAANHAKQINQENISEVLNVANYRMVCTVCTSSRYDAMRFPGFFLLITQHFWLKTTNNNQSVVSDSKLHRGNLQSLEILETNWFGYATMMNFRIWIFYSLLKISRASREKNVSKQTFNWGYVIPLKSSIQYHRYLLWVNKSIKSHRFATWSTDWRLIAMLRVHKQANNSRRKKSSLKTTKCRVEIS